MPALTCSRCSRANPAEARFCYWDGMILAGAPGSGPVQVGSAPFANQFVFPNGQACRNFDQLALACQQQWGEAVKLLKQGFLASFLGGLGRLDLAAAAQEAAAFPDPERGLDQFLARLPSQLLQAPILKVEPKEINLGIIPMGADKTLKLKLSNHGMRLCYGTIVSDSKWLTLGDGQGQDNKIFQFVSESALGLHVRGQHLRAGNKPLEGNLVIESNGGNLTIAVRAEVPATPFPEGMFMGALAPRQIAEKAKAKPLEAAPLFERGVVARWYASNGWPYPVQGPTVPGIGGVQQFFEALGLAKPPKVELKTPSISLRGDGGATLQATIEIAAAERKVVWAYALSDQPWVDVSRWKAGKVAVITVNIPRVPNRPYQTINARIQVTANGNQKFTVPLSVAVGAPSPYGDEMPPQAMRRVPVGMPPPGPGAFPGPPPGMPPVPSALPQGTPPIPAMPMQAVPMPAVPMQAVPMPAVPVPGGNAPMAAIPMPGPAPGQPMAAIPMPAIPVPMPAYGSPAYAPGYPSNAALPFTESIPAGSGLPTLPPLTKRRSRWWHLAPLLVLFLVLLILFLRDMIATAPSGPSEAIPVDESKRLAVIFDWGGPGSSAPARGGAAPLPITSRMVFGVCTVAKKEGEKTEYEVHKFLTFDLYGRSNNVLFKIDGKDRTFGLEKGDDLWVEDPKLTTSSGEVKNVVRPSSPEREPLRIMGKGEVVAKWKFGPEKILVTQRVKLLPGEPVPDDDPKNKTGLKRNLDTLAVYYAVDNQDKVPHTVGVRVIWDTFIGGNDGVPFTIPGEKTLIDTMRQFEGTGVPDFLFAQENPDSKAPGTVVRLNLKLGGAVAGPSRVLLTHWPGLGRYNDWAVETRNFDKDSAVVLYWDPEKLGELKPGAKKELGFTYGLGNLSTTDTIALSVGGSFAQGSTLSVVAQVAGEHKDDRKIKLILPEGLSRVEGDESQPVPAPYTGKDGARRPNPITWRIRADVSGVHTITVETSDGKKQSKKVLISSGGIF